MPEAWEEYEQGLQELQRLHARDALRVILARAESGEFGTPGVPLPVGVWKEVALPWERGDETTVVALLKHITLIQDGGTAANFDLEIRTKAGGTGLEVVLSKTAQAAPYDEKFPLGIEYLSEEAAAADRRKVVVAIKPNGGTGSYQLRIYGRPLR